MVSATATLIAWTTITTAVTTLLRFFAAGGVGQ